jgi:hypothetical protein
LDLNPTTNLSIPAPHLSGLPTQALAPQGVTKFSRPWTPRVGRLGTKAYLPTWLSTYQPIYQLIYEAIYQPAYQPIRQPTHQLTHQPTHQPIYQPRSWFC